MNRDPLTVRWRWVTACWVVGSALVVAAAYAEHAWGWVGVSVAAAVNVGTTVALAGVLVLLEGLVTRAVGQARDEIRVETAEVAAQLSARQDALAARLDEVGDRTKGVLAESEREQAEAVDAIGDRVDFNSLTAALEAANEINAIDGRLTVKAGFAADAYPVTFSWGIDESGRRADRPVAIFLVEVGVEPEGHGTPVIEVIWGPEDEAEAIGARLVTLLKRADRWSTGDRFDWQGAISELRRGLELSVTSRNLVEGSRLVGSLFELWPSGWAFTTRGLVHQDHGLLLAKAKFPQATRWHGQAEQPAYEPECPSWVDASEWRTAVDRAASIFSFSGDFGAIGMPTTWRPLRPGDLDRR